MKLKTYLNRNGLTQIAFAEKGGFTVYAIRKWVYGDRTPRVPAMIKIAKLTKGKVKPSDWVKGLKS